MLVYNLENCLFPDKHLISSSHSNSSASSVLELFKLQHFQGFQVKISNINGCIENFRIGFRVTVPEINFLLLSRYLSKNKFVLSEKVNQHICVRKGLNYWHSLCGHCLGWCKVWNISITWCVHNELAAISAEKAERAFPEFISILVNAVNQNFYFWSVLKEDWLRWAYRIFFSN